MRVKRRPLFEEYLDRRTKHASQPQPQEPPDHKRRVNVRLRYLGIIVPMLISYALGLFYFGATNNGAGFWAARAAAAASWLGFTAVLSIRRDWAGAGAITAVYIFFEGWMWLAVTDGVVK